MNDKIKVLHKNFKIAIHEYDEENDIIGAQCSKEMDIDSILFDSRNYMDYSFNTLALASLVSVFDKAHLILFFRMLEYTVSKEYGVFLCCYDYVVKYKTGGGLYKPCNLYELADELNVPYKDVQYICSKLLETDALYVFDSYIDRFHTEKDKIYIFNPKFLYADGICFNTEMFAFDDDNILLWYQSNEYDEEYNKDPKLFEQKCRDGWRGEAESSGTKRESPEYKKCVKSVLERDNSICQCCGSTLNPEVHHILPYAQYKDLRTEITNGITLCECCHSRMILGGFHQTYGTRNNTKEQLQEYIDNKREKLGLAPITIDEIVTK